MTIFPCAKVNLGLNVVSRRPDGYHNIETVFYPIPLFDALEVHRMDEDFPCESDCDLKLSGIAIAGKEEDNLVVRAYQMLARDFELPRVHVHLLKRIPAMAGLGGGSSDAAYMIRLLDERFHLNMGNSVMEEYAARLGADCAFFITSEPAFAEGIGNELEPVCADDFSLEGKYMTLVRPDVAVSTREAYGNIKPRKPQKSCRLIVQQPIETWRDELTNDFEETIFPLHPEIETVKNRLYDMGAVYAQMSGSGSCVFGIFDTLPVIAPQDFPECYVHTLTL
jgi:4-diphosphocytidyl-2-C-methyl-D-erythritol kinase